MLTCKTNVHLIKAGTTIIEGTADSTDTSLAHICNIVGFKYVIFMPDNQLKAHNE